MTGANDMQLAQATTAGPEAPSSPGTSPAAAPEAPAAPSIDTSPAPAPADAAAPAAQAPEAAQAPAAEAPAAAQGAAPAAPAAGEAPAGAQAPEPQAAPEAAPGQGAATAADPAPAVDAGAPGSAADAPGAGVAPDAASFPDSPADALDMASSAWDSAMGALSAGGPAVWAIAALSVATLALILWKTWTLMRLGAWSRARSERAMAAYMSGGPSAGLAALRRRPGLRGRMLRAGFRAVAVLPPEAAREETARVAKNELAGARTGLRALELIATAAPLLGLLGTVLGMIAAFRTLEEAGGRADPAMLAGGIWEALLTTAAGMAVAIPASAALAWFESVADRARQDMEDLGARLFLAPVAAQAPAADWTATQEAEARADAA